MADTILELEITPNRPDCMSVVGVAREVGAVLGVPASVPASSPAETGEPVADSVQITIADPALCPRYTARLIRNVKIGPSPEWLAERVQAAGARSISNVVDITNYVMFELGQPLHAFDADTLGRDASGRIAIDVRLARAGETLRTLDGQDRDLTADTLLITDPTGPIALAGVMGGESTEISDTTVNILLESASFSSSSVSHTRRRLGLLSEASARYERGVDPAGCAAALDRAAALMAEYAGGEVAPGIVDTYPAPAELRVLTLRVSRLHAILGAEVPAEEAAGILTRLGCDVLAGASDLTVVVPSFRPDLEREIDLIEEVLRVYGMERVPATLPSGRERIGELTRGQHWRERIGATLRACGLNETMTYSLRRSRRRRRACATSCLTTRSPVSFSTPCPQSSRCFAARCSRGCCAACRTTSAVVWPTFTSTRSDRRFKPSPDASSPRSAESWRACWPGAWHRPSWNDPATALDFFDGKGVIEAVGSRAGNRAPRGSRRRAAVPPARAQRGGAIGGSVVGWLGEVHPLVADAFEAAVPVTAFELELAPLVRAAKDVKPFADVPKYPAVELDMALVVAEDVTAERLEQVARSAGGKLLESVGVFDVYRGKGVPAGKKSVALSLTYRSPERTLTAEEVDSAHDRLVRKVIGAVGGELRG